ncbi:MAG: hypothetical protein O3B84_08140, partial [Chloroflexi bacterium]|nr:hypothetical protein [Chloroflexota bacterium]
MTFPGFGRHRRPAPRVERILVPVSGTAMDEKAVQLAGGIVQGANKASIFIVYIIEVPREFPLDGPASG